MGFENKPYLSRVRTRDHVELPYVFRTSSSEVMGFKNKQAPGKVRTRDLGKPKPNVLLGRVRTRNLSAGNFGQND